MNKFFILLVSTLLLFISCSDDIEREDSPTVDSDNPAAYFVKSNPSKVVLQMSDNSFEVTISRPDASLAKSIIIKGEGDSEFFNIPDTVDFEVGKTDVTINVSIAKDLEPLKEYSLILSINDSGSNPYLIQDGYPVYGVNIVQEDFVPYATGTYTSVFFEDSWPMTLEYSAAGDTYRFTDLWEEGYNVLFSWDKANLITIKGNISGTSVVVSTGYIDPDYGLITAYYGLSSYDDATKTFTFPITWRVSLGSFGTYPDSYVIESLVE